MANPQPWTLPTAYVDVPPPPRRQGPRLLSVVVAFSVVLVLAVAVTALVTAAIVRSSAAPTTPATPTSPTTPQYSAAEQNSAKQKVCQAFDAGERGSTGQGGAFLEGGQLNVPLVLKWVNSVVGVQNALSPATPAAVSEAVHEYLTTTTDLTTAALANKPVAQINDLTKTSNSAIDALVDVCGLPR
jgi:hypothetical protein